MPDTVNEILVQLKSDDFLVQIQALDLLKSVTHDLLVAAAGALANSSCPYPLAEKLFALGPMMIPALEQLVQQPVSKEGYTYAALILLRLGSRAGLDRLLRAVEERMGPAGMIANNLGAAGIGEAIGPITVALRNWDVNRDPYTATTLVLALRRLNAPVPRDVLEQLRCLFPNVKEFSTDAEPPHTTVMETSSNDWIAQLEGEWSKPDGFLGMAREGLYDRSRESAFLGLIQCVSVRDDLYINHRLVALLWYIPIFLTWQKDRIRKNGGDIVAFEQLINRVTGDIEQILGVP
jgi:hypothetical protein